MPRIVDAELFGPGMHGLFAAVAYLAEQPAIAGRRGTVRVRPGIVPGDTQVAEWRAAGIELAGLDAELTDSPGPP